MKICGISYPVIINEHRLGFPAVSTSSTHHSPLRYGDTVCCILSVSKVGKSSTVWNYSFSDQTGRLVWSGEVTTVCVDLDSFESVEIPLSCLQMLYTNLARIDDYPRHLETMSAPLSIKWDDDADESKVPIDIPIKIWKMGCSKLLLHS